ncbi:arabinofuranosidase catalytic domain-containing protein, partial [Actinocrinis sp.]|uniref:arabinofuranosidase catalytic domain-containing protein n=1 Tax=Actinocrinis sp. TaxID=1920516 RepID=UPI0039C88D59
MKTEVFVSLIPRIRRRTRLLAACLMAVAIAVPISAAATTSASASAQGPCDIYAAGGTPCETAHSTIRALFAAYNGPLYQVKRSSDNATADINTIAAGGVANAPAQDSFCANTTCTITKIYDQTSNHNDMPISWGGLWKGPGPNGADIGANATALPITIAGHKAYGVKGGGGVGYRVDNAKGVPTGSQPEGVYMITSSNYVSQYCCFDYGSGENSHTDTGNATMNAIEWGTACWFGGCSGSGPWVEADLENGMYSSNTGPNQPSYQGVHFPFVTAMEKNNGTSNFTIKYANAASGGLTTGFSGPLPNGYSPMKVDSSILLGTGGDNSANGNGEFFEGAVTAGYPSDATENAVQANLAAAGYGSTSTSGNVVTVTSPGNQSGAVGTPVTSVQVQASDSASGQTLTFSATGLPPGLSISASGLISGTPTSGGTFSPVISATDSTGATGATSFTWAVSGGSTGNTGALHAVGAGKCLDDPNSTTTGGTQQQIYSCNGAANQTWTHTSSGALSVTINGTTMCLDANGKGTTNGTKAIIWSCNGQTNQQWNLNANGTITGVQSGL